MRCRIAASVAVFTLWTSLARADPLADAVTARCTLDLRLAPAVALALHDPEGFDDNELRDRAWNAGLRAPTVQALVLRGGDTSSTAAAVSRWLERELASVALSRCSFAANDQVLAVALVPRVVEVRSTSAPGAHVWQVDVPSGATGPTIMASSPEGEVLRAPVLADGTASLAFDARGTWTLQVIATLATGPVPLAMWTETFGAGRTAREPEAPSELWSSRDVVAAINELRRGAGLAPVRRDPMLDRAAGAHAERLAAYGGVSHTPTPDDSPVDRVRSVGVITSRVAENVARARTLTRAQANLARSPSHRANLLDVQVDAVGVGIARASGAFYLVELFAAAPSLGATSERAGQP